MFTLAADALEVALFPPFAFFSDLTQPLSHGSYCAAALCLRVRLTYMLLLAAMGTVPQVVPKA